MHQLFQFEFQQGKNKHIGYFIGGHPVRGMTFFVQGSRTSPVRGECLVDGNGPFFPQLFLRPHTPTFKKGKRRTRRDEHDVRHKKYEALTPSRSPGLQCHGKYTNPCSIIFLILLTFFARTSKYLPRVVQMQGQRKTKISQFTRYSGTANFCEPSFCFLPQSLFPNGLGAVW